MSAQVMTVPRLTGRPVQVSPHVWVLTGFPVIVYVVGDHSTLVVDTGLGSANGAYAAAQADQLTGGRGTLYLTTTHMHAEHAAGVGGFPAGTVLVRAQVQQDELAATDHLAYFRTVPDYAPYLDGAADLRPPDVTFDETTTLDLGGVHARLFVLGPAHTLGDELVHVEEDRALITGDVVQNKVVPFAASPGASYASWLDVLDRLAPLRPDLIVPTHSAVGGAGLIPDLAGFLTAMRASAADLSRAGAAPDEAVVRLGERFRRDYPTWADNPDWANRPTFERFAAGLYAEVS
jgi:glyoxylase-like metal-dependent hydrolase (beta-lactamase superfamily II)